MKKSILFLIVAVLFIGCSEKEKSEEKIPTVNAKAGKIEVVEDSKYEEHVTKQAKNKEIKQGPKGDAFYYDYNKEKKAQIEEKTYTPVDANMRVRSPYEKVEISLLVGKLSKQFILKCSACHNDYANGVIGPSLMGKNKDFIYSAIMDFKIGKKENPLMNDLIHLMSNEEIEALAQEISDFNSKIKELREKK